MQCLSEGKPNKEVIFTQIITSFCFMKLITRFGVLKKLFIASKSCYYEAEIYNLETFILPKKLVDNPFFHGQRKKVLHSLDTYIIDPPIIDLIKKINMLSYCFTQQSCYGHFIFDGQQDAYNIEPLPVTTDVGKVKYKIAYIALCLENSALGIMLLEDLKAVTSVNQGNIQFLCAEWFWQRQVNSYVLQVEPERFKCCDTVRLDYAEALYIEKVRDKFFAQLSELFGCEK